LLQSGIDANAASSRGITPLHVAAKEGHFRLLQFLIYANAHVNAQSTNGITPLVLHDGSLLPRASRSSHLAVCSTWQF
jgi:ankyrin repeat protein